MFTIELPDGTRTECQDAKEGAKLLRKAQREQAKRNANHEENRQEAEMCAALIGYRVLRAKADGNRPPRYWVSRDKKPAETGSGGRRLTYVFYGADYREGKETKRDSAEYTLLCHTLLGCAQSADGKDVIAFFQDIDRPEDREAYAIGVYRDAISLLLLPGVTIADFE